MNLEELMILFIPQVVFFQGVKLSKVALPYSSTNKKIKELQLESGNGEWLKCWCVLRGGVWPPIYIVKWGGALPQSAHKISIHRPQGAPCSRTTKAVLRGLSQGLAAQGTGRSLGGTPRPPASHVGPCASSHEGCVRGNCSRETSLDVLVIW